MVRRHNKRVHNGKDRHTGRKIPNRSEHDKKVKTRSIGTGKGFVLSKIPGGLQEAAAIALARSWIR